MAWTEERIATLKKLWAESCSAGWIARELGGVTRNAVIGKAHRMGLQKPGRKAARQSLPQTPRTRKLVRAKTRKAVKTPPIARQVSSLTGLRYHHAAPGAPLPAPAPGDVATVHSVLDLKSHHCRWPVGDPREPGFGFCGAQKDGPLSYCSRHAAVAYEVRAVRYMPRVSFAFAADESIDDLAVKAA